MRSWIDARDAAAWTIDTEGRAAELVSDTTAQIIVFRGSRIATAYYDGAKELAELTDSELQTLLDAAGRAQ